MIPFLFYIVFGVLPSDIRHIANDDDDQIMLLVLMTPRKPSVHVHVGREIRLHLFDKTELDTVGTD